MASVLLAAGEEATSSRVAARLALQAAGHQVREVHDGRSVLAQAETERPDLLVLDTDLPIYDGFQVLDRLRRHHALRHLPVVVLSTIPRSVGGEFTRSLGAVRYLARPFTNADLDAAVVEALAAPPPGTSPLAAGHAEWPAAGAWRPPLVREAPPAQRAVPDTSAEPPAEGIVELPTPPRRRRASPPHRPLRRA